MRYFLEIAYRGTGFHGWQSQINAKSVQGEIENALKFILKQETSIQGSSRTDTGVHAYQQFAHFDLDFKPDLAKLTHKLNSFLVDDIVVRNILPVPSDNHARFDAISRKYIYYLCLEKNPFYFDTSCFFFKKPDFDLMNLAAERLLFHENFECFSKVKTAVNNFNCNIKSAVWVKGTYLWEFHIESNRFLRGMVRAIVGTLLEVGIGKITVDQFEEVILSNERNKAGKSVLAKGLFLSEVNYPSNFFDQ